MIRRKLKRTAVTLSGFAVTGLGIALLVLPGPGFVVVAAGLAILATEYDWAKRLLVGARQRADAASRSSVDSRLKLTGTVIFGLGMVAVGLAMVFVEIDILFVSATTGVVIVLSGLVLLGLTGYTYKTVRLEKRSASTA